MATTYTPNSGLAEPAHGDRGWDVPLNGNTTYLDGFAAIGNCCCTPNEIPSASLIVKVADGIYELTNRQLLTYPGGTATLPPSSTTYLWLDETGVLNQGAAFPVGVAIFPLAKVVTVATVVYSIADYRCPWRTVGLYVGAALFNAGPATGAAAAPVYRAMLNTDVPKTLDHTWVTDFVPTVESVRLDQMALPTEAVSLNGQNLTNLADPVNPQDAATKHYADLAIQGLDVKPTATVGTTAALPANTYLNGSSGVGASLTATANGVLTVDGHAVGAGDLVLVMHEATQSNNGLYVCTTAGTVSVPYVLTRHVDMDQSAEFVGAIVPLGPVGTALPGTLWLCGDSGTVTVGTTAITFSAIGTTATTITVGTTVIAGGTSGDLLYNSGGVLGQLGLAAGMGTTLAISGGNLKVGRTPLYTATYASSFTLDLNNGDLQIVTLTGNITITPANVSNQPFTLILQQDGSGGHTTTFSGMTIRWVNTSGSTPTLSTTASKSVVLLFIPLGSGTYLGFVSGTE